MNFACGALLLVLEEEEAYWGLVALVEYLFPHYYEAMVMGSMVDQTILGDMMQKRQREAYDHIEELGLELPVLTMHWFNSLFVEVIPFESLHRVFDLLLADGREALLRVSLAFLLMNEELILTADSFEVSCPSSLSSPH